MKKYILLISFIAILSAARSQAPVIMGLVQKNGAHDAGTLITYTAGQTSLTRVLSLPQNSDSAGPTFVHLTQAHNGKMYGLTGNEPGVLFEYNYQTNGYTVKANMGMGASRYSFYVSSLMLSTNGIMYSVTGSGGVNNGGFIYSYVPGDTGYTKLHDLPANSDPIGSLVEVNGRLYGMTGYDSITSIYEYDVANNTFSTVAYLPHNTYPVGKLLAVGDTLYGATEFGGSNGGGIFFSYVIGQSGYNLLYNFDAQANGLSEMILATDKQIYGITPGAGTHNQGTIFRYNIGTATYTTVYNFGDSTNDGAGPISGLLQATDSIFYGTTYGGGTDSLGTIYTYNLYTGAYHKMVDLNASTGSGPYFGSLTQYFTAPVLVSNPASMTACAGVPDSFTTSYSGLGLRYQWQVSTNGGASYTTITGATRSAYVFAAADTQSGYMYRAIVYNNGGIDTSMPATLTVTSVSDTASVNGAICSVTQAAGSYLWLDCSSGQPISGATSQSYTATTNGNYRCLVTISGCPDTTNCVAVTTLGIDNTASYDISLSPNPASGMVTIRNTSGSKLNVKVASLIGQELMRFDMDGNSGVMDIGMYPAGIYIVSISDDGTVLKTLKLVRE